MAKNPDFTKVAFSNASKSEGFEAWRNKIEKETGKNLDLLITETMEQVNVDPLYTAEAYKGMEHLG